MALSSNAACANTSATKGLTVKQERHDEAEIRELAAKMVEANKAKIATTAARSTGQQLVQTGQPGILNFITRSGGQQTTATKTTTDKDTPDGEKPPCDEDSGKGKFGWVTLGKCFIPYILRYGEKYCAVRMVELKLLSKYLSYLHADIYNCTCIRSYYITEQEAKLLNEINQRHCDSQFGRDNFTGKDLVVRLQDAAEFYNFLDVCYNKLLMSSSNPQDKCGFIRINGESVVPYTVRDNFKYVPLFYFEGETDNLKLKAEKLEGWDLAYLKFCCKVQGIRNELFAHETCSVISLGDIKSYFPPGTVFEDYWPSKVVDSQLLITSTKGNPTPMSAGMWTNKPKFPPPAPSSTVQHVVVTNKPSTQTPTVQSATNGWSGLVGGQPFQPGQLVRMSHPPSSLQHQANNSNNNNATSPNIIRAYNPSSTVRQRVPAGYHSYGPQVTMTLASTQPSHMTTTQPPPLVRSTGGQMRSAPTYSTSSPMNLPSISPNSMHHLAMTSSPHHQMLPPPPHYSTQQRHTPPNNNKYPPIPPPLISTVNGGGATGRYGYPGADVIDLSPVQQPAHTNGRSNAIGKLVQIGETATSGVHIPYKVQKALVDNKMVPCINSKPFINSELLMTIHDLVSHFFPTAQIMGCHQILQDVLRINLFQGNRQQMQMLRDAGKCQTVTDIVPLIQVRDVINFMPQMKYMFNSISKASHDASPPAKRSRTS